MATLIASDDSLVRGADVLELSTGYKVLICTNASLSQIRAYGDIDGTPTQLGANQTMANVHSGPSFVARIAAVIDSSDVIWVFSAARVDSTRDIAYATLSDIEGTPTWSSWSEAAAYDQVPTSANAFVDASINSTDDIGVTYADIVKTHGTPYRQILFTEWTGASWSSPIVICATTTANYDAPSIEACAADDLEAVYTGPNGDLYYIRRNGSWGSENSYAETSAINSLGHGPVILCTTGDTIYRFYVDLISTTYNLHESGTDTAYNIYYPAASASYSVCLVDDTDRYVFYIDTGQDVHLITNDGGGWTDRGDLVTGTHTAVVCEWHYNNYNVVDEINYVYQDSANDLYYESYSLAVRRIFITHV